MLKKVRGGDTLLLFLLPEEREKDAAIGQQGSLCLHPVCSCLLGKGYAVQSEEQEGSHELPSLPLRAVLVAQGWLLPLLLEET